MRNYTILFILLCCSSFLTLFSQNLEEDLKFKHYTSTDGLSQRSVMAILESKKGYLWIGTRDGLNKFDGKKFKIYRHFTNDSTSLSNNNIHSIYQDTFNNIWIGTQNGLNKLNPSKDNFKQYKSTSNKKSIAGNIIWGIIQVDNYLFVATNSGISRINIITDEIKNYRTENDNSFSLSDNNTRSFLKCDDGNLWITNIYYIDIFNPVNNTFKRLNYPKQASEKIFLNDRPTLFQDSQNTIWLGYNNGIAKYNKKTQKFEDYIFNGKKPTNSAVRSICEDLSGNLWIGSYDGLYILNSQKNKLRHVTNQENRPNSLSQNSIYKITLDSRGDIWIGTWAAGINYYNRDNQSFKNISFGKSSNTLNYKVVSGMAEDSKGNLWIGTEGGGLNYLDRKKNQFTYYTADASNLFSISANNIKSVIRDRKNKLWIGIHDGGVNYVDLDKKPYQFKRIDFPKTSEYTLRALKVLNLLEDINGNIWIGTLTGGVIHYNTTTKKITKLDKDIRTVMCLAQTKVPNILLAGGDNGLEKIDINTLQKTKINILDQEKSSTESLYINTIFTDNYNNYWLGTEGQGVYKYNPNRKESKNFGLDEGLPSDIIYGILSDDNGNLWISTNYGVTRFNQESDAIKNFSYADGLQGNEFNYGAYFKTSKNELFFGGTNGLTYFNPSDIQKNTFIPKIDIHNLNVNNSSFLKVTDSISNVVLNYNQNNFSVNFSVLSFMQPANNQYAYKLEGYDSDWNYTNLNKAIYTNIDYGDYIFKIKGANNDGIWNNEGATLVITIKPPFWQTWIAYLIYILIIVGIAAYIRKLILEKIEQKKELAKEKLEREKVEETNKLKLKLFTDVSHEFRTPLTLITGPLERMISKNMGDKFVQEQHKIMHKNAKILLQLINQILDFRKNESGHTFLQASKNNIVPFIKDVKESFKALAQEKNVNYQFNTTKRKIEVWFDQIKLKKILFNLISNAFKFTKDNNVLIVNVDTTSKIKNNKEVEFVVIEIINFVSVIPESHIKLIFDRFYQLDSKNMNMGSGIGLSLTKRLVELHKGFIEVNSSSEQGTCFSVYLQLGKEHLTENDILLEPENISNENFLNNLSISQEVISGYSQNEIPSVKEYQKELETILIVEDSFDVQEFIKNVFIDKYNIILADNGKEGYEKALNNKIDLIISDVSMPEMDGFELCEKIKTTLITSHIPVILLTARTSQTHQEKGYSIGANTYITKPFNPNILETRVDNLLKTRASLIRKFKKDIVLKPKELTITSTDELFLQKAIKVVDENLTNPDFNTAMFIELMNMSRTVLYTKLKALTGQNLSTFIRVLKLKRAGQLIAKTDMNISQIAYEVGFNDLKYFRKCFKEHFKKLPSQYRNTKKE